MVWVVSVAIGLVAAAVTAWVVPRVTVDDPDAPEFAGLASPRWVAVSAVAALASAQILWLVPQHTWWLWSAYLAFGVPLILVDLRTTFLPRALDRWLLGAMAIGLAALALADLTAAAWAVAGGAAACLFLFVAYRVSGSLGFGDVRLAAAVGAVAGQHGLMAWAVALFAGTALGAVHGIVHAAVRRAKPSLPAYYPYGPALWLGPLVAAGLLATGWSA
ncbi:MAG TPA: prepilin peptidase [Tessaracoccus flavescens]|uniref:Prepilin peptidase n=1 Tax=Tessaracoccus flavescens TaxID=399497 RepID=A0A921EPV5_9ACTN|nr:prepilin peptidase [Tessaracoccus flavescens]